MLRRHARRPVARYAGGAVAANGRSGFVSEGELFIVGRIKDLLIIRGRNHHPEDIEATVQEITRGRVAAISVPDEQYRGAGRRHRTQEARRTRT